METQGTVFMATLNELREMRGGGAPYSKRTRASDRVNLTESEVGISALMEMFSGDEQAVRQVWQWMSDSMKPVEAARLLYDDPDQVLSFTRKLRRAGYDQFLTKFKSIGFGGKTNLIRSIVKAMGIMESAIRMEAPETSELNACMVAMSISSNRVHEAVNRASKSGSVVDRWADALSDIRSELLSDGVMVAGFDFLAENANEDLKKLWSYYKSV